MFADVGGVPTVMQTGSPNENGSLLASQSMWWVFALVIIFFALIFWRRDGNDNRNPLADVAALNAMNNSNGNAGVAFTELNSRLDNIQSQIGHNNDLAELRALYTQACATDMNVTQQAFNVSNLINQNRTDTLLNLKDAALQQAQCCCDTNRNIDNSRFEASKNTCDIINASNQNTQRIMDRLTESEISRLRDDLADARLNNSQCNQNAFLLSQLRPYPVPAYSF